MTREEMMVKLTEIRTKRLKAFGENDGPGSHAGLDAMPEVTTYEDIKTIYEAVDMLDEFEQFVVHLSNEIAREWGKYRCSVCGRTTKQSEAIGYNCAIEC